MTPHPGGEPDDAGLVDSVDVDRLRAKAWQSARPRTSGGTGANARDHICWLAATRLEALSAENARLRDALANLMRLVDSVSLHDADAELVAEINELLGVMS